MFLVFVLLVTARGDFYAKVENFGTSTSFVSAQGIFASDQDGNIYATDQTSATSSVLRKFRTSFFKLFRASFDNSKSGIDLSFAMS